MQTSKVLIEAGVERLVASLNSVIHGKPEAVERAVIALLAGGHLLIEDVPGVGKTSLARALARGIGGSFRRVQFTSDLMPADILGVNVFDPSAREFRFRPGPVFCNVLLADEINRTTPRTQSALLQAMEEHHVTLDGTDHDLPDPFFVIATQNPLEHHGTFPLPESQLDRFLLRLSMGYPAPEAEKAMIRERSSAEAASWDPPEEPALSHATLDVARREVEAVHLNDAVLDYLLALVAGTRSHRDLALGASPRAALALARASRAAAYLDGRDYVTPDDVKQLVEPVLAHRLVPAEGGEHPAARQELTRAALAELIDCVPVPL